MKANKFAANDSAVSPVIGVILMVAITVVLAAVVFVLVQGVGSDADAAPKLGFNKLGAGNGLQVVDGGDDLQWSAFTFIVSCPGTAALTVDGAAVTLTAGEGAGGATAVNAGDQIVVDDTAGSGSVTCTLAIRHEPTNELIYEQESFTFST